LRQNSRLPASTIEQIRAPRKFAPPDGGHLSGREVGAKNRLKRPPGKAPKLGSG